MKFPTPTSGASSPLSGLGLPGRDVGGERPGVGGASSSSNSGATGVDFATLAISGGGNPGEFSRSSPFLHALNGGSPTAGDGRDFRFSLLDDTVTVGRSLVYIRNIDGLCCGSVGTSGTKFCTKQSGACNAVKHNTSKVQGLSAGVYILSNGRGGGSDGSVALVNPCFDASDLSPKAIGDLLSKDLTVEEARDLLSHYSVIAGDAKDNVDEVQEDLNQEKRRMHEFKTPAKKKFKGEASFADPGGDIDMEALGITEEFSAAYNEQMAMAKDLEKSQKSDSSNRSASETSQLVTSLLRDTQAIQGYLASQSLQLDQFAGGVNSMGLQLFSLFQNVKRIEDKIGTQNSRLAEAGTEATLWDALASLVEDISNHKQYFEDVGSAVRNHSGQFNSLATILKDYRENIVEIKDELAKVRQQNSSPHPPSVNRVQIPSSHSHFASLGIALGPGSHPPTSGVAGGSQPTSSGTSNLSNQTSSTLVNDLIQRVNSLEQINRAREQSALTEAVRIMGHTFTSAQDVEKFFIAQGHSSAMQPDAVPRFGLWVDPLTLYMWGWTKSGYKAATKGDNLLRKKKLEMNEQDLTAFDSYEINSPLIYAGTNDGKDVNKVGMDKSRFARLPSYASFDSPVDGLGVKQKLEVLLGAVKTSLAAAIERTYGQNPLLFAIANDMLEVSHSFIKSVNDYMKDAYSNFVSLGVGTQKEIWALITFIVEQFFEVEFAKARQEAIGALEIGCRDSGFRAIWCAMKCCALAKRIMSVGIKDHPSVSASIVRYVLTQSNMGKVASLESENKELRSKLDSLVADMKTLKDVANGAKKAADAATSKGPSIVVEDADVDSISVVSKELVILEEEGSQIETGVLVIPKSAGSYLVVCDGWPSIAIALESLKVESIHLVLLGDLSSDLEIWFSQYQSIRASIHLGFEGLSALLRQQLKFSFIWFQLRDQALHRQCESLLHFCLQHSPSASVSHGGRLTTRDGFILSHKRCGGITLGRWMVIGLPKTDKTTTMLFGGSSISRSLKHVLKSTESGVTCGPPSSSLQLKRKRDRKTVYLPSDAIPVGTTDVEVISPSVFSPSKFVRRKLVLSELLDAYDLQVDYIKSLCSSDFFVVGSSSPKPIAQTVVDAMPEKIAYRVAKASIVVANSSIQQSGEQSTEEEASSNPKIAKHETDDQSPVQWIVDEIERSINDEKAARDDDIPPDIAQWDQYIVTHFDHDAEVDTMMHYDLLSATRPFGPVRKPMICYGGVVTNDHKHLFNLLRNQLLKINKYNVRRSFVRYLNQTYGPDWQSLHTKDNLSMLSKRGPSRKRKRLDNGLSKSLLKELHLDIERGSDAISKHANSEWWDWTHGSTLFFWRWHPSQVKAARDGIPIHLQSSFQPYWAKQSWPSDPNHLEKVKEKLLKVISRGYIGKGSIVSLTGFFAVPKGATDIRMVYDATKCGLNDTIWCPTFYLPTIDATLRQVSYDGFMSDIDLGDMFLNFPLDERVRKYVGIDVTALRQELVNAGLLEPGQDLPQSGDDRRRLFLMWTRCLMGLKCSPYNCVKVFAWAEEFIRGDIRDPHNPFFFSHVITNFPGSADYDPGLPRVYRWNVRFNSLSGNFEVYIDDIRCTNSTYRSCTQLTRRVASRVNYLGMQDAARKRRFPSQTPGLWSGAKSLVTKNAIFTSTTQEKWDKGKGIVSDWIAADDREGQIDYKNLEKGRGFLIHLGRTYPSMVPYFKGIHHLLESWRCDRNSDGWKLSNTEWRVLMEEINHGKDFKGDIEEKENWRAARTAARALDATKGHPSVLNTNAVGRFRADLDSLSVFMKSSKPPRRLIRGKSILLARYGFGDASGGGFGATWETSEGIQYRFGVWGSDNEGKSSNFRELTNLTESLEAAGAEGQLVGIEIFVMTDNSTSEQAYYKGTSSSPLLHALVHRLRILEISQGCKIHLVHVAGTRMIAQGTDGLSRGNLSEGVMRGSGLRSFIPLHETAFERQGSPLKQWMLNWISIDQDKLGPPIFLSPDDWFTKGHDPGNSKAVPVSWEWESACNKCAKRVMSPLGLFCGNYGSQRENYQVCTRSWCSKCYAVDPSLKFHIADAVTDAGAVWKRKKDKSRFLHARDGDMWSSPFQCEWCWFTNINKRDAVPTNVYDEQVLKYLRRMNLDVMWSREVGTVKSTLSQLRKGADLARELRLPPLDIPRGPWPVADLYGAQLALEILRSSQREGKHSKSYQQYETIRKLRSAVSNAYESSPLGINVENMVFRAEKARVYGLRFCPTESFLFDRFMQGLLSRMGKLVIPDEGIDNIQVHGCLKIIDRDLADPNVSWSEKRKSVMLGSYIALCYGCSLRGYEGLYLERTDFVKGIPLGKEGVIEADGKVRGEGHVCAPLLGRFKNEAGEQKHVVVMVNVSKSGLRFRVWMERLAAVLRQEGLHQGEAGPAFCHEDGTMIMSYEMNDEFIALMERLKDENADLFPEGLDISKTYGVNRSLRRGSNSRATEEGVSKDVRDLINRWSSFEAKRGQRPNMSMAHHYIEIKLIIKRTLEYSKAL